MAIDERTTAQRGGRRRRHDRCDGPGLLDWPVSIYSWLRCKCADPKDMTTENTHEEQGGYEDVRCEYTSNR